MIFKMRMKKLAGVFNGRTCTGGVPQLWIQKGSTHSGGNAKICVHLDHSLKRLQQPQPPFLHARQQKGMHVNSLSRMVRDGEELRYFMYIS